MSGLPVIASTSGALAAGIRTNFTDTYTMNRTNTVSELSSVLEIIPSDKLTERYAYYTAASHPVRWPRGESIQSKPFSDVTWTVTNLDYAKGVEWHKNDERDDQTKSLVSQARDLGANFGLLPKRLFYQILLSTTDANLLPAIPTAADGAALFAATAGGAARFGVTGGNIITGSGVGSAAAIEADFYSAVTRLGSFQDGEGQQIWDSSVMDKGFEVFYGLSNNLVVQRAFKADAVAAGGLTATSNATVSNMIKVGGFNVKLTGTSRITTNDLFVAMLDSGRKPIIMQDRQGVEEYLADETNSDAARATGIRKLTWNMRMGWGIATPYAFVQIDN